MNVSIDHPTDRPNFSCVKLGELEVWFSYRTPIAFRVGYGPIVVRVNEWGATTGKHMAYLGNRDRLGRISGMEFERQLGEVLPKPVSA